MPEVAGLVDLSNVCRDAELGGSGESPRWSAFLLVRDAWKRFAGDEPSLLCIADANLRFLFGDPDRVLFDRWVRGGLVREKSPADDVLLDLCERTGALVISKDAFIDHRSTHPWIQGNTDKFLGWERPQGDPVRLFFRDMGVASSWSISRAEERGALETKGLLDPGASGLLDREYRCTELSCVHQILYPDRLLVLPDLSDAGEPVCPGCGTRLEDIGTREPSVEIKIASRSGARVRVRLVEGDVLALGRVRGGIVDLARLLFESDLLRVSRRHVELTASSGRLTVSDLGSTNGTRVLRQKKDGTTVPEGPLPPGAVTELGHRDVIDIAGVLTVARSGQRYPTANLVAALDEMSDPQEEIASVVASHDSHTEVE